MTQIFVTDQYSIFNGDLDSHPESHSELGFIASEAVEGDKLRVHDGNGRYWSVIIT